MGSLLFRGAEMRLDVLVPGQVSRKVKAHGEKTMMVEVCFEAGGIGTSHSHPHEQLSYCLEGSFDFTIGDSVFAIVPGDSVLIPGGVMHGVVCRSKGRLLDVFSPPREDFLS